MAAYVELQVMSHFSFLRGASSPEELFAAAALQGHGALGLADWGSVAGVVRGWDGQKTTGVRMIPGARVHATDGHDLLLYPQDRAAWSRLTRLLSIGKARGGKGFCILDWADIVHHAEGLVGILLPDLPGETAAGQLADIAAAFGDRAYCGLSFRRRPDDAIRLHDLAALAARHGVRAVALGDVLYHSPEVRPLQDVVTAIREKTTVDALGYRRERFMDRHLKPPAEMERRFRAFPDAIQASADIARACTFDLGEIQYQYPYEQVMVGRTAQEALAEMTEAAAAAKFPHGVPQRYRDQIRHELRLIEQLGYAPYFLTVNSIVAESRRRGILCQGRGSAANSCVCYLLGITSIDPIQHELLFERFVSGERKEPPDIDVDFENERREEIIQWIYETYGRDRSAAARAENETLPKTRPQSQSSLSSQQTQPTKLLRLHLLYLWRHRRILSLRQPRLFTELIQRRKLLERDPRIPRLIDKLAVKDFVGRELGREWVTPTLWSGHILPSAPPCFAPFVVKSRHGCNQVRFVRRPGEKWAEVRRASARWMRRPYGGWLDEWGYDDVPRGLIIEPFLGNGTTLPIDYKLFVFHGRVRAIQVHLERESNHRWVLFDPKWRRFSQPIAGTDVPPPSLQTMIEGAEQLAQGFDFVRVDLYEINGSPRFGEMTFYPGSGLLPIVPADLDREFGHYWSAGMS